jgi:hypothetical protein
MARPVTLAGASVGRLLGMLGTTHWITPTEPRPLCSETRSLVVVTGSKLTPLKVLSAAG